MCICIFIPARLKRLLVAFFYGLEREERDGYTIGHTKQYKEACC